MDMQRGQSLLSNLAQYSDVVLAAGVVGMILVMLIPLPPMLLDLLLSFNITFALVILLISLYALRPLDFSVFPSLLLVATLSRLSLNVSSTRLILLRGNQGEAAAGQVIRSFGKFVIGGNYVVGLVVFVVQPVGWQGETKFGFEFFLAGGHLSGSFRPGARPRLTAPCLR